MKTLKRFTFFSLFIFISCLIIAQNKDARTYSGRVTDEKGEVLVGANIVESSNEANGTTTDEKGNYSITLPNRSDSLTVSYIGFTTQHIRVGSNRIIDIILSETKSELQELVVVGYGQMKKISLVSAQSQVNVEAMKTPSPNLTTTIAGQTPGVVVVQRTGEPGHDGADIWIRGISTFSGNSSPLVLVDGVERSWSNIDPNDIESFNVLKDASATAVYGVRGANGVILITTKQGTAGKPQFTVDYYAGATQLMGQVKLADAFQYMDAVNEAYNNVGLPPSYTQSYINAVKMANGYMPNTNPLIYNKYLYPDVDWMKELFNNYGSNNRLNFSVRGGVPNASYYVSASYYGETGLTKTDDLQKYNASMSFHRYNFLSNVTLKPFSKTKIEVGIQGYVTTGNYPGNSSGTINDAYNQAMWINPVAFPVVNQDGTVSGVKTGGGDFVNPYAMIARSGYATEKSNQINSNIKITQNLDFFDFLKGLSFYAMYAYDGYNFERWNFTKNEPAYGPVAPIDGNTGLYINPTDIYGNIAYTQTRSGSNSLTFNYDWNNGDNRSGNRNEYFETALNYSRTFNNLHSVSGLLLFNAISNNTTVYPTSIYDALPKRNAGLAGRVTYSYADRYLVEGNFGYNGSDNFLPSHRYGFFPSIGLGWVISNESFWNQLKETIPYFKIRYSNGYIGNDVVPNRRFAYSTLVGGSNAYWFGPANTQVNGYAVTDYGSDVTWETSHKQDVGLDFKVFDLSITADYFYEFRNGIFLQRRSIPTFAGLVNMPWGNIGETSNKGIEASLVYTKNITKDLSLEVRGNITHNKAVILNDDQPPQPYSWLEDKGHGMLAFRGYVAAGLFTSEEDIKNNNVCQFGEQYPGQITKPGDIKYVDLNDDGKIDQYDMKVINENGDVPNVYYGFGATVKWRNFSIGGLFNGTQGAKRYVNGKTVWPFYSDGIGNMFSNINDRWQDSDPTNQNVFYPRLSPAISSGIAENQNNYQPSTWWLKNVDYLQFKQLSVTYDVPKSICEKLLLAKLQIYIMGNNLWMWSPFTLWDAELNTGNGTLYPDIRTVSLGVTFNF